MDLPILTSAQMRAAEQAAFANGVQVEALMNKAGAGVAQVITKLFQKPGRSIVFAGKDVENRSWRTSYRGTLLIHASSRRSSSGV